MCRASVTPTEMTNTEWYLHRLRVNNLAVRTHKGCTTAGAPAAVACCHNEGTVRYAGSGAHSSISSSAAAGTVTHAKSVASHHSDARKDKRHWMDVNPQSWLLPPRRVRCIVMFSDLSSSVGRDLATPTRCIWSAAQYRPAGLGRPARSHVFKEVTQDYVI